jgi:aryl-alcohol dehydrogenase-like predicted oxidoreductase
MRYVKLGDTGEIVSEMCLGTMMFGRRCDQAESDRILGTAIDHGVTFIDTAAMYEDGYTEEILGHILKGRRDKLFIGTKVHRGTDARTILESIDESLARMQIEYVDLYMIHWPREGMNPREIMEALSVVVEGGKARYVGCCNYSAWLLAHSNGIAARNGWPGLVCNQVPYNLIERGVEVEVLPQAVAENVAITVYRPLLMGILAGKYKIGGPIPDDSRGKTDRRIPAWLDKYGESLGRFNQFAADHGLHPAQLAIAWVRYSPATTGPIVGVSSAAQLEPTLAAFDFDLTDEQYIEVTGFFDTGVKEEGGGEFPRLRRELNLLG